MKKHSTKEANRWLGLVVGAIIISVSIAVCTYLGVPEYIRSLGLFACVFAGVVYVHFARYGKRLWFWVTVMITSLFHVPIIVVFVQQINRASPALTIPLAMLDGVLFVVLVVLVAGKFEKKRGPQHT